MPVIGYHDTLTTIRNVGPCWDLPETTAEDGRAARIRKLAEQGLSKRQIALEVFGYAGGAAYTAAKQATTTQTPVQATVSGRVG